MKTYPIKDTVSMLEAYKEIIVDGNCKTKVVLDMTDYEMNEGDVNIIDKFRETSKIMNVDVKFTNFNGKLKSILNKKRKKRASRHNKNKRII